MPLRLCCLPPGTLAVVALAILAFPQVARLLIDAAFIEPDLARLNYLALTLVARFTAQAGFSFLRAYLFVSTVER